jgi:Protein of unknown function (DUF1549)/Protein of unknown function (DUF1553)/Planctomycete cytochrome C
MGTRAESNRPSPDPSGQPRRQCLIALAISLAWGTARADSPGTADAETFERNVRPILAGVCLKCHGGAKTSGGLRVDSRAALIAGGDSGPAIVSGDPGASLLIAAVRHEGTLRMPPSGKLRPHEIAALEDWVRGGAIWPKKSDSKNGRGVSPGQHWAFLPVVEAPPPPAAAGESLHPIDRFLARARADHGLKPASPAPRRVLVRRVYLDLIGLPPSPEEVEAFVSDPAPDAYERLVDRLLASPCYGERWGRHWLDVARYADTDGSSSDYPIPEAHLYRDYVIDAFNADKPYDQFLREQVAGDLLPAQAPDATYAQRVIATGFLAQAKRYGNHEYSDLHLVVEDAIDTIGRGVLGLSLRCARCHDHKYDPTTQADYYALYGVLASTQFPSAGNEHTKYSRHLVPLASPSEVAALPAAIRRELAQLRAAYEDALRSDPTAAWVADLVSRHRRLVREISRRTASGEDTAGLQAELNFLLIDLGDQRDDLINRARPQYLRLLEAEERAGLRRAYAVSEPEPPRTEPILYAYQTRPGGAEDTAIQVAGNPAALGAKVPRGVPGFLPGGGPLPISAGQSGRLELARWLAAPENPLTARVMVNRLWRHHFGLGLVEPDDFGLRGSPPTHPELLDRLAAEFVRRGWSIKAMHRLIVTSEAYRLSSLPDRGAIAGDPDGRWLTHYRRRRLDAESLRDALLWAGGALDLRRPGAHPFPPRADWSWTQHEPFFDAYDSDHRSVYQMRARLRRDPVALLFDGPDPNRATVARRESTVPLQSLYLMNNPFVLEHSGRFARRLIRGSPEPTRRVELAFRIAYSRCPSPAETEAAIAYVDRYRREAGGPGDAADEAAWTSLGHLLFCSNEFLYVD